MQSLRSLALCAVVAASATACTVYNVSDRAHDAQLLWTAEEGYLFVTTSRLGWQRPIWRALSDRVVGAGAPTDQGGNLTVVTCGRGHFERVDIPEVHPGMFQVVDGVLYTGQPGGLFRWSGKRLKPVPANQSASIVARYSGVMFDSVNGWSGRVNILNRGPGSHDFVVEIARERWTVTAYSEHRPAEYVRRLTIRDPSGRMAPVLDLTQRLRSVNEREFHAFLSGAPSPD